VRNASDGDIELTFRVAEAVKQRRVSARRFRRTALFS
jgi:hypothetical protein